MNQGKRMKGKKSKDTMKKNNNTDKNNIEKNKKQGNNNFFKFFTFIYIVITIAFYIAVIKMDLLPMLYITIFTTAEIVLTLALSVGMIKRHKTMKLNILCFLIVLAISVVYIGAIRYILATTNFIGNTFTESQETEEYYVVVRKNNEYNKIENIKDKDIYTFQLKNDIAKQLEEKYDVEYKITDKLKELGEGLINEDYEVILISASQYVILDEEIKDFKNNTEVIYTLKHVIEKKQFYSDKDKTHSIKNGIFNVYISGMDTDGDIDNVARSDANIIATVNARTHEVLLTSIPRDYYVELYSYGAKDKLTHSGMYGIEETISTVEELMGIDINYYVRVNFSTVVKLVDTLDGIDVYSDYDFSRFGHYFEKGYNHVYGESALVFSRERYSFEDGDNQRVRNQQHVIEAILKKVTNSRTILTKYTDILEAMQGSFQTNIKEDEISSLVKGQLENMTSWTVKTNSLTGYDSEGYTYSMGSQPLYVMIPDSESIEAAKEQIENLLNR